MSVTRKGSRRICVEGEDFVWLIRRRPTYCQAAFGSPMHVAIQKCGSRSVLVVVLDVPRPDMWGSSSGAQITPAHIRAMIREARQAGWKPDASQAFQFYYVLTSPSAVG